MTASAMFAELEPPTATEVMLATQMVGAPRLAMRYLASAKMDGQTVQGAGRAQVLRAARLMRIFNEQLETMAKLKGKGGQQRVVVEDVTVSAGVKPSLGP